MAQSINKHSSILFFPQGMKDRTELKTPKKEKDGKDQNKHTNNPTQAPLKNESHIELPPHPLPIFSYFLPNSTKVELIPVSQHKKSYLQSRF